MDAFYQIFVTAFRSFGDMHLLWIPLIFLIMVARMNLGATAWWHIIRYGHPKEDISWRKALEAHSLGVGLGALVPLRGSDLVRATRLHFAGGRRISLTSILASSVAENVFGAISNVVFIAFVIAIGILPLTFVTDGVEATFAQLGNVWFEFLEFNYQLLIGVLIASIILLVLIRIRRRLLNDALSTRMTAAFDEVARGLRVLRAPRWYLANVASYQALDTVLVTGLIWSFAQAFGFECSLLVILVIQFGGNLAGIMTILPQNVIVKQGLLALLLSGQASVTSVAAFSISMDGSIVLLNVIIAVAVQCWSIRSLNVRRALRRDNPLRPAASDATP